MTDEITDFENEAESEKPEEDSQNENYFEDIWKPMFRATLFTLAKI